jgi:hypothetical protein
LVYFFGLLSIKTACLLLWPIKNSSAYFMYYATLRINPLCGDMLNETFYLRVSLNGLKDFLAVFMAAALFLLLNGVAYQAYVACKHVERLERLLLHRKETPSLLCKQPILSNWYYYKGNWYSNA